MTRLVQVLVLLEKATVLQLKLLFPADIIFDLSFSFSFRDINRKRFYNSTINILDTIF